MTKKTIWVLTREHNNYDQYGEYLHAIYANKPTLEQLIDETAGYHPANSVPELLKYVLHLQAGGGRVKTEDVWFTLTETTPK